MTNPAPAVLLNDATVKYQGAVLFENLNLTLAAGKFTCLLGPSGVGKSTLLRMIAGLMPTDADTECRATITTDPHLAPLSENIAYSAQHDALLPWLTAWDNALLGPRLAGKLTPEIFNQADTLFQQLELHTAREKFPAQLSGGMRQRVALLRTLLLNRPIILMDEPFAALDAITRYRLQNLTATLLKHRTVCFITHDPLEALRIADEIYILAGQPATLQLAAKLHTKAPRELNDPEVQQHEFALYQKLLAAKDTV